MTTCMFMDEVTIEDGECVKNFMPSRTNNLEFIDPLKRLPSWKS